MPKTTHELRVRTQKGRTNTCTYIFILQSYQPLATRLRFSHSHVDCNTRCYRSVA